MASTTTRLMSFEEFEQLPESNWMRQELHRGELIEVPPPKHGHMLIELRLRKLLENADNSGIVATEMGFRPTSGPDYLIADIVFIPRKRWDAIPPDGYMMGAPELVIEVRSPSNRTPKMRQRRQICLENGCLEFWIVDSKLGEVEVSTPDGYSITYKSGQQLPLFFATGSTIAVDAIFE
jgi:Uma2 family endonuclease